MNVSGKPNRGSGAQSAKGSSGKPANNKIKFAGKTPRPVKGQKLQKPPSPNKGIIPKLSSKSAKVLPKQQADAYKLAPAILDRAAHLGGVAAGNLVALPKALFTGIVSPAIRTAGNLSYQACATFIPIAAEQLFDVLSLGAIPPENLAATANAAVATVDEIANPIAEKYNQHATIIERKAENITKKAKEIAQEKAEGFIKNSAPSVIIKSVTNALAKEIIKELDPTLDNESLSYLAFCASSIALNNLTIPDNLIKETFNNPVFNINADNILREAGIQNFVARTGIKKAVMLATTAVSSRL